MEILWIGTQIFQFDMVCCTANLLERIQCHTYQSMLSFLILENKWFGHSTNTYLIHEKFNSCLEFERALENQQWRSLSEVDYIVFEKARLLN